MEISKELLDMGLTEELLLFYHTRTANSKYTIKSAYKSRHEPYSHDGVKVVLVTDGRVLQYIVNIAKIRQKRLNIILNVRA